MTTATDQPAADSGDVVGQTHFVSHAAALLDREGTFLWCDLHGDEPLLHAESLADLLDRYPFEPPAAPGEAVSAEILLHRCFDHLTGGGQQTWQCRSDPEDADSIVEMRLRRVDHALPGRDDEFALLTVAAAVSDAPPQAIDRQESLVSLGRFAAHVAHELSNPLDGVLRYAAVALANMKDGRFEDALTPVENAHRGLTRMAQVVRELLAIARDTHADGIHADINEAVADAVQAMQPTIDEHGITVAAHYRAENMPLIRGGAVFQVCCNLIKNACDAMPDGGRLNISTSATETDVLLSFEDSGPGLPANKDRLFEPFYTTKSNDEGTGLGLAISKSLIERLGGAIRAVNADAGGALFMVSIPRDRCIDPDPNYSPRPQS